MTTVECPQEELFTIELEGKDLVIIREISGQRIIYFSPENRDKDVHGHPITYCKLARTCYTLRQINHIACPLMIAMLASKS